MPEHHDKRPRPTAQCTSNTQHHIFLFHIDMTDQPALGPDGRLRDASEIDWYNDPDDNDPIQPTSVKQCMSFLRTSTSGGY
jgi:hypothetical protein